MCGSLRWKSVERELRLNWLNTGIGKTMKILYPKKSTSGVETLSSTNVIKHVRLGVSSCLSDSVSPFEERQGQKSADASSQSERSELLGVAMV
jgi:hypothetical protein